MHPAETAGAGGAAGAAGAVGATGATGAVGAVGAGGVVGGLGAAGGVTLAFLAASFLAAAFLAAARLAAAFFAAARLAAALFAAARFAAAFLATAVFGGDFWAAGAATIAWPTTRTPSPGAGAGEVGCAMVRATERTSEPANETSAKRAMYVLQGGNLVWFHTRAPELRTGAPLGCRAGALGYPRAARCLPGVDTTGRASRRADVLCGPNLRRKRHVNANVIANVAIARELAGWCWSLAIMHD